MEYCAFLRGVNVKGTAMKMAEVCDVFQKMGLENVSSVLATGNIIFSSEKSSSDLKILLEKAMSEHFNYESFMFIKTENEVSEILKNNPFTKSEEQNIYIFVTEKGFENQLFTEFDRGKKTENESATIVRDSFYWQVTKGNTLDSHFGKILGKKSLKDKITSRNINTFEKIVNKF